MITGTSLDIKKSLSLFVIIAVIGISLSTIAILNNDINLDDITLVNTESTTILPTESAKLTPIMEQKIAQIQIPFIKNEGQADSQILYYAKIFSGQVAITSDSIVYDLNSDGTRFVIKESFGNLLYPQGMEKSETDINYFVGAKENWKNHVPAYQNILVQTPWYNIDAKVISHMSNAEKIFTVHPYGNPSDILISVDGPDALSLSDNDELVMHFGSKKTSFTAPVAYQMIQGRQVYVDVTYVVFDKSYGFSVGKYDKEYDLVIDPLVASTFLGGSDTDIANAIAISSGNVYVTGSTSSTNFPTVGGAYDTSKNSSADVFVSKFNSGLTSLSASTYLGGSSSDVAYAIAISSGNVYVTGNTASTDFPTIGTPYDTSHNSSNDVFVSKFNSDLTTLSASTYLGGSDTDIANAIAISSGNVYVTGHTASTDFPSDGGRYTSNAGSNDVFVSKFNSDLTTLSASTYIGGSSSDVAYAIAIDSSGNVYVAGDAASTDFPTVGTPYDTSHNSSNDVFVSKFTSNLGTLSASTYLGGSTYDIVKAIAIDSSGNVYVTGYTASTDFPTVGAYDTSQNGSDDVFISKFNSNLTALSASTFLGGAGSDIAKSIAIDSSGNVYVTGNAVSTDFPTIVGAYDTSHNGGFDGDTFVSKFNSGLTSLSASTFLGGSNTDKGYAIAIDSSGNVYVTGYTASTNFPTIGAYDESHNSSTDVFVSMFSSLDLVSSSEIPPHGSGCADCTPPTLGVDHNSKRLVTNGFSYNANPVDVELYYTPYPLITANIGHNNTAEFKIYENSGVDKIRHFDFAFGLAKGEILSESKARIEWDKNWDGTETITLIDPNNVLQNVTISTTTISCQDTSNDKCLLLLVFHTFRAPLEFDIVATNVWDEHRNAWQNYYNHGIHITGESLNPPKQYTGIDKGHIYHLTETGKNMAVDESGDMWSWNNTWIKDYKYEKLQDPYGMVMTRDNSNFYRLTEREIDRAEDKLLTLCPECLESYDLTPSIITPYHERINKLDDPKVQKNMVIESDKAQKIMDALVDIHDRHVGN